MKKKLSEKEIDYIVGNIIATYSFEGMDISKAKEEQLKKIVRGEMTEKEYTKKILEENGI